MSHGTERVTLPKSDVIYPVRLAMRKYLQGSTPDSITKVYVTTVDFIHP